MLLKASNIQKVQAIQPLNEDGKYIIGVEGGGIYRLIINNNIPVLSRYPGHSELESLDVKSIYKDQSGSVWISTFGAGLCQIVISANGEFIESETFYNTTSGLPGENVRTVFEDMEENIWIGFYGEGLSLLSSKALSFFTPSDKSEANSIIYINQSNSNYLLGTPKGYYLFNLKTGKQESFTDLSQQVKRIEILSFLLDKANKLWIGTKGSGLYLKHLNGGISQFYRSGNNSEDNINHIASDGKNLWLSTLDGVIVVDINSGIVRKKYKIEDRLPHNSINQIFINKEGGALVATYCNRLYNIHLNTGVNIGNGILPGTRNKINCFTESDNNEIWAGSAGNGLFYILNDSVTWITTENGLLSNYCRSILADSDNKIWISMNGDFQDMTSTQVP